MKVGRKPITKEDIPTVFYKHSSVYADKKMDVSEPARICMLSRPTIYNYPKLIC